MDWCNGTGAYPGPDGPVSPTPQTAGKRLGRILHAALRFPGYATLFVILFVDLAIMGFAVGAVVNGIEKQRPVKPAPQAVLCAYQRPLPSPAPRPSLLVDDFSGESANCLGGTRAPFINYGGLLENSIEPESAGGAACLRLAYDVSSPSSICGYASDLCDADLSLYRKMSFQIRGESSDEVLKIEVRSGDSSKAVSISQLLPDGVPAEWRTVSIPLKGLVPAPGQPQQMTFLFEHDQGMPYTGTVYIRNIRFR